MLLKCPACNAGFSLEAAIGVDAGRSALLAALQMPALGGLLAHYLGMFRAAGRSLSFDRVEKLLGELKPMLDAQNVTRNGTARRCPHDLWQQALERMVEHRDAGKLQLPLKTHGYLLEIAYGLADAAGAKAEKVQEAAVRTGAARADGEERMRRQFVISAARGDVELGLATPEQAKQRLRDAGINPEVLDG
jgi:hypothetical protein